MSASCNPSAFIRSLHEKLLPAALEAGRRAVDKAGEHILGQAQKLAPVDTGALKASATSTPAAVNGMTITKTIGFNTSYAAAVHERLDLQHDQGQAKFLETAIRQNQVKFNEYVVNEMRKG